MAAVDYFLKIDGIEGESQDKTHKDEIQLDVVLLGRDQRRHHAAGGGGGAGKVQMQDFHFVMNVNKASPKLFLACANGEHIKKATLTARKAGKDQQDYLKVTFSDLLISSYQTSGQADADHLPLDQISFNFAKMEIEYKEQKADGTLGGSVKRQLRPEADEVRVAADADLQLLRRPALPSAIQAGAGLYLVFAPGGANMNSKELFQAGRLAEAIQALGAELRDNPTDTRRRTFLFELLCFAGEFDRAEKHLDILAQRRQGRRTGRPALPRRAQCRADPGGAFPEAGVPRAVGRAGAVSGTLNGKPFEELSDGDPRIGPRLEVYAAGQYLWIPFAHIKSIEMQPPRRLRDLLWAPALVRTGPAFKDRELGEVLHSRADSPRLRSTRTTRCGSAG